MTATPFPSVRVAVAVLFLLSNARTSLAKKFVGCRFSDNVCDVNENCIEDQLFGSCLDQWTRQKFEFAGVEVGYRLDEVAYSQLRATLRSLIKLNYKWKDHYTQAILLNFLEPYKFVKYTAGEDGEEGDRAQQDPPAPSVSPGLLRQAVNNVFSRDQKTPPEADPDTSGEHLKQVLRKYHEQILGEHIRDYYDQAAHHRGGQPGSRDGPIPREDDRQGAGTSDTREPNSRETTYQNGGSELTPQDVELLKQYLEGVAQHQRLYQAMLDLVNNQYYDYGGQDATTQAEETPTTGSDRRAENLLGGPVTEGGLPSVEDLQRMLLELSEDSLDDIVRDLELILFSLATTPPTSPDDPQGRQEVLPPTTELPVPAEMELGLEGLVGEDGVRQESEGTVELATGVFSATFKSSQAEVVFSSPSDEDNMAAASLMKSGQCPVTLGMAGVCGELCSGDTKCPGIQKCCYNGCGHTCVLPTGGEGSETGDGDLNRELPMFEETAAMRGSAKDQSLVREGFKRLLPSHSSLDSLVESLIPEDEARMVTLPEDEYPGAWFDARQQATPSPSPSPDKQETVNTNYVFITVLESISQEEGEVLVGVVARIVGLLQESVSSIRVSRYQVSFRVLANPANLTASDIAMEIAEEDGQIASLTGIHVTSTGIGSGNEAEDAEPVPAPSTSPTYVSLTFIVVGCVAGILIAVIVIYVLRKQSKSREKVKGLSRADQLEQEPTKDYQDLCRQRMASQSSEKPEPLGRISSVTSSHVSEGAQPSPSSRSSTSSWSEEPVHPNMDISTGHILLSYMEDHLKNKGRLAKEWEALCQYEAEPSNTSAGSSPKNLAKNRFADILPYDHSRVLLNESANLNSEDYINASTIMDHDPRSPAYLATQAPMSNTAADFWQMVWEQGCMVIVSLAMPGEKMAEEYWPSEGSQLYHTYEVHLVSEHIWCDDYLVRSFYLKNLQTNETRTVTQFHFLTWPDMDIPASPKPLLEFRRKVNKSFRGRACPIVVHCSDGVGRSGTYCLVDMVLNRMTKGAKEIDIAATLEHIRDQRIGMVATKDQFEFALTAVAEEVNAILKAMPQ